MTSSSERIVELSRALYAAAATIDKGEGRHPISDAATLIEWIVYLSERPTDTEARETAEKLLEAIRTELQRMLGERR